MKCGLLIPLVAALAFLTQAQGAPPVNFAPQQSYACGGAPRQVRAADFNGDGLLDLVTANSSQTGTGNSVSLLLDNGEGTFLSPINYPTGALPQSVFAVDLNGDGNLDLTVANGNDPSISVLLGNGDGVFTTHQPYYFDPSYWGVIMVHTMADFDGDGDMDIACIQLTPNYVVLLWNDGTGTFGSPQIIGQSPGEFVFYTDLEPGDFDGDGDPDLFAVSGGQYHQLFLNNGNGTFAAPLEFTATVGLYASPFADLNGDGNLDLAMAKWAAEPGGYIMVVMGNGDGTFGAAATYNVGSAYGPTTSDIDRDGDIDLVVPSFSSSKVSVLLNNGDGTFAAPLPYAVGGNGTNNAIAVDLNNDSWPDIVTVNRSGNNASVLINLNEFPGDMNCDGAVNFGDINPFVLYLSNEVEWQAAYPGCPPTVGDINADGTYPSFQDINPFVVLLSS